MPVDFLTPEQEQRYGRYTGEPTPDQLARCGGRMNCQSMQQHKAHATRNRLSGFLFQNYSQADNEWEFDATGWSCRFRHRSSEQ